MLTARSDTIDVVVGLELAPTTMCASRSRCASSSPASAPRSGAADRAGDGDRLLQLGPLGSNRRADRDRDGTELALTRTEFDLLVELTRHPGQVLSRDTLLDRIWGYDYLGDSRLVDVAVGRLRAKIEPDPAAPDRAHGPRRGLQGRSAGSAGAVASGPRPRAGHRRAGRDDGLLLGVGAYVFVDAYALRASAKPDRQVGRPVRPAAPARPTPDDIADSVLRTAFRHGVEGPWNGDGKLVVSEPGQSAAVTFAPELRPASLRRARLRGWTRREPESGDRRPEGRSRSLFRPRRSIESALGQLRLALGGATAGSSWRCSSPAGRRGVLAAGRCRQPGRRAIGSGDLSARVPVTSDDEFGRGRAVQPDGRGSRDDRAARGGRGPEPAVRRGRGARAADTAGGPRRRGVDPAGPPRSAARRAVGRGALVADVAAAADPGRRPNGDVALRRRRGADRRRAVDLGGSSGAVAAHLPGAP